ncbi:hypothetical protein RB195_005100 [Necator americanus]|uniref:Reverse transcriptase domain-containing protein n=1 Tax=Necator americanus TaxID=51031 RepID=A0ABR1BL70_NECAM
MSDRVTTSPKIFTATLDDTMLKLKWDDMRVKVDGRQLHHLRFDDDIVLRTSSINQAERMLAEFEETCGSIDLQLTLKSLRNMQVSDASLTLNRTKITECNRYLCPKMNMKECLTLDLRERKRAAWVTHKTIGCNEEDQEHPASIPPSSTCFDLYFRNLDTLQARRNFGERHCTLDRS